MSLWGVNAQAAVSAMLPALDVVLQRVSGRGHQQLALLTKELVGASARCNLLGGGIIHAADKAIAPVNQECRHSKLPPWYEHCVPLCGIIENASSAARICPAAGV